MLLFRDFNHLTTMHKNKQVFSEHSSFFVVIYEKFSVKSYAIVDVVCFSVFYPEKKENPHLSETNVGFMERVTRLELATSTLARWRSTG